VIVRPPRQGLSISLIDEAGNQGFELRSHETTITSGEANINYVLTTMC
jgi:hypothetical protein